MKKQLNKIAAIFLVGAFFVQNCLITDAFALKNADNANLAPPKMFAVSSPDVRTSEFKQSILSDIKFLTVVFSIGAHFLVDNKNIRTLSRVMRDEFRNNPSFLDGIDLINTKRKNNIVYIPYQRGGKPYEVRISTREILEKIPKRDTQWALSERWGIQVVDKSSSESSDAQDVMREISTVLVRSAFIDKDALSAVYGYAVPLLLDGRDMDLYHTETVFNFMNEIIEKEGVGAEDAKRLLTIALLHDIGYTRSDEADFRAADKRLAHMEVGARKAREILAKVNSDIGRSYYSREDIDEICRVISIHDNPSIKKPFDTNDKLALIFRPADRLAMLERTQFGKDIERRKVKEKGVDPAENLTHVINRHTEERLLYPNDAEGFIGKTLYTTPAAYTIFAKLVADRIKDIEAGHYGYIKPTDLMRTVMAAEKTRTSMRPAKTDGTPGELVKIEGAKKIIAIGDLHADIDRFEEIMASCGPMLEEDGVHVVLLGDYIGRLNLYDYNKIKGTAFTEKQFDDPNDALYIKEGENAFKLLAKIAEWQARYPGKFHVVAGNSEYEAMKKRATAPFRLYIGKHFNKAEQEVITDFVANIPIFAVVQMNNGERYYFSHNIIQEDAEGEGDLINYPRARIKDDDIKNIVRTESATQMNSSANKLADTLNVDNIVMGHIHISGVEYSPGKPDDRTDFSLKLQNMRFDVDGDKAVLDLASGRQVLIINSFGTDACYHIFETGTNNDIFDVPDKKLLSFNEGSVARHEIANAQLSELLASEIGFDNNEIEILRKAALVHDAGSFTDEMRSRDAYPVFREFSKGIPRQVSKVIKELPEGQRTYAAAIGIYKRLLRERGAPEYIISQEDLLHAGLNQAQNSLDIMKSNNIIIPQSIDLIVRYHHDYEGFKKEINGMLVSGKTTTSDGISLETLDKMMVLFMVVDKFNCGNDAVKMKIDRNRDGVEDFPETIGLIEEIAVTKDKMGRDDALSVLKLLGGIIRERGMSPRSARLFSIIKVIRQTDVFSDKDIEFAGGGIPVPVKGSEKPGRDLSGKNAPSSDGFIQSLIRAGGMAEISYENGKLRAHTVRYLDGYEPGDVEPEKYRGENIDVNYLLSPLQQKALAEWISRHHIRGAPVRFRVSLRNPTLGWESDIEHSIIAHAGYRDRAIYIGHAFLRYILNEGNEGLLKEVLDKDEFRHIAEKGFSHDSERAAYNKRKELVTYPAEIMEAMRHDDWKMLLKELRTGLESSDHSHLLRLLKLCEEASAAQFTHPLQSRYPIERAVTLLDKNEKDKLSGILNESGLRYKLVIVDSILLMIDKENRPKDWIAKQTPRIAGRRVWEASSEIWYPAGGLGRVMQYHSIGMEELGANINDVEPLYHPKTDDEGRRTEAVNINNYGSFPSELKDIKEVFRYPINIGNVNTYVIVYKGVNKYGVDAYFISDTGKGGQREGGDPYYTRILYNYQSADNPVSWEEFSAFMSMASLILVWQAEKAERAKDPSSWKAPIIHGNDAQLALISIYLDILIRENPDDEVLREIHTFFTTHTYPNRVDFGKNYGHEVLKRMGVPARYWKYFYRDYDNKVDITSGGIRFAHTRGGWVGGVSAKHVDDVQKYDKWGEWADLQLMGVTNGDYREFTAEKFRKILLSECPGADVEHPTADQILKAKRKAKELLGLDPDKYVVSYSGRLVPEKIGRGWEEGRADDRDRAFHDKNIEEYVKMGVQVVIYGNVQKTDQSLEIEKELRALESRINSKGYPGKFIFVPRFDLDQQRALLAATDIQIQDSDPETEAAGYSEADVAVCGGLQMAPPWTEGILQAQGIPINLDVPGEGNTIIPENGHYLSYLKALKNVLSKSPEELSEYQATSVRLSRILEAILTSAEYLRQFDRNIARDEERKALAKRHDPYNDAKILIRAVCKKLGLPEEKITELERVGQERVGLFTDVLMDNGTNVRFPIYACLHNKTLGTPKGGISIAESKRVFPDEIRAKSAWMTIKTALVGVGERGYPIGLGGGKSGIVIPDGMNINNMSVGEIERLARGYTRALYAAGMIGPETYVPAPDIGVDNELGGKIMAWIADEYERLSGHHAPEMVTGKTVMPGSPDGGILGRDEATERGGLYVLEGILPHLTKLESSYGALKGFTPTLKGKTVAVQGAGKVGNIANLLHDSGAEILGWSDRNGALHKAGGLPVSELSGLRKNGEFLRKEHIVARQGVITNEEMIALPVDVLVLAATGGVITEQNVDNIKAKVILCLANGPITPGAETILKKRGVLVIPDVLANAGGVTVSFFEMLQNMTKEVWTIDRTRSELKKVMQGTLEDVLQVALSEDESLTDASYMVAIRRIIRAQNRTASPGEAISLEGLDIGSSEHEQKINTPWRELILAGKARSLFAERKALMPGDINIKMEKADTPFLRDLRALRSRFIDDFDLLIGDDESESLPPYLVLHAGNRRHQAYIPRSYINVLSDLYNELDASERPDLIQVVYEALHHEDMHIRHYDSTLGSQGPPALEKDIDLVAPSFRARALFRIIYAMRKTGRQADLKGFFLALRKSHGKKASYLYGYSHLTSEEHLEMAKRLLSGKPSRVDIILAQHHLGDIFNNNDANSKVFKDAMELLASNNRIAIDIGPETGKPFPLWKFIRELMRQNALIANMSDVSTINVKARSLKQFEPWQRGTDKYSGDSVYYPKEGETTALPVPLEIVTERVNALTELEADVRRNIIDSLASDSAGGTIISRASLETIGDKLLPKCAIARSAAGKGTRDEEVNFDIEGNKVRLNIAKAARKVNIDGGRSILEVTVAQIRGMNKRHNSSITLDLHTSYFTDLDVRNELNRLGFQRKGRNTYMHPMPHSPEIHVTKIRKTSLFDMNSGDFYRNVKTSLPWEETFWPDAHDTAFIDFIASGRAYETVLSGRPYQLVATIENLAFTPDPIPLAIMKLTGASLANEVILQPKGSIGGIAAKFREEYMPGPHGFGRNSGILESMEIDEKFKEGLLPGDREAYFPLFNSASYAGDILEFVRSAFMPGAKDEEVMARLKEFYDAREDSEKLAELRFRLKNEYRQKAQLWEQDKRYPALQPMNMSGSLTWFVPTVFIEVPAGEAAGKDSRFEWLKDNNLANLYRDLRFTEFLLTQNDSRVLVRNAALDTQNAFLKEEAMLKDLKERYGHHKMSLGRLKILLNSRIRDTEESLSRIQDKGIQEYAEIGYNIREETQPDKDAAEPEYSPSADIVAEQMKELHAIDIEALPHIEKKKTLWHVIPIGLIPPEQRNMFIDLISSMQREYPEGREKIRIVTDRQDLKSMVEQLVTDSNNLVDVALDSEADIDKLPGGVKMLVFKPAGASLGNFRQIEGMIAGLRLLHMEDRVQFREKMSRLYEVMTGHPPKEIPDISDPREFARKLIFELPPITVESGEELEDINRSLRELLRSA